MTVTHWGSTLFLILNLTAVIIEGSCTSKTTCDACIQDPSGCVWCAQEKLNTTRCKSRVDTKSWCDDDYYIDPQSTPTNIENLDYNNTVGTIIQIKPQKLDYNIRVGDSVKFELSFKSISDYPVDLYFLVDVSGSMKKIINYTINQAEQIYRKMNSLTRDVRLGLGSFVDKNTFPFTHKINSTTTYSFKHHLRFTSDPKIFRQHIADIRLGQNNDEPESGLEAIAQVIACKHLIGWRKESRKIIVYLSDGSYHAAGDGKWGGIVKPYDGKCYMNEDGTYSKELELDYPSVSIISKMARDEAIVIIFGINQKVENIYLTLQDAISGSICLSSDTFKNDMAGELQSTYESITQNIKLKVSIPPVFRDNIVLKLMPECGENININCKVQPGKEIKFKGILSLKSLPESTEKSMKLNISVAGIDEKLTLSINVISKCNCDVEHNSTNCHQQGTYQCGICECNSNRYGKICECEINSQTRGDNATCVEPGTNVLCSEHGTCSCGICHCRDGRSGAHCECDNESCTRVNGTLCNGHGVCQCNSCKCEAYWSGEACECNTSEDNCLSSPKIKCSNAGICDCNSCKCNPIAEWDARTYQNTVCEMQPCELCHVSQCQKLETCVQCYYREQATKNRVSQCNDVCFEYTKILMQSTKNLTLALGDTSDSWKICADLKIVAGCYINYAYQYNYKNYSIDVLIDTMKNCAESYYYLGALCIGTIIIIGILTLLGWKFVSEYQDRKEYAKFIKSLEGSNREYFNPLHVDPVSNYTNPMFNETENKEGH